MNEASHSKVIKVDCKGFDFYCHKKEQPKWIMGVKLVSLIWFSSLVNVDLTSNFIHCLSNLFEKVFVGLNHQIFQLWLGQRFSCSKTSSSPFLYSAAEHTSLTAFLTNHKHRVSAHVNSQIRLLPCFHAIKVSLSGFFLSSLDLDDESIVDGILIDLSLFSVFTNIFCHVSFVVASSL